MTIEEAFSVIENLDCPEGLRRKLAPGFSLLQIDRKGDIACVERFKYLPTETDQLELLNRFPGTVQINGKPGMYSSCDELRLHVRDSMWLFDKMQSPSN